MAAKAKERIIALDYLRGFFIFVIIIDHLNRWPTLFVVFTGQGVLWSTAAEGFFIISGLLIGYIRGYKERHAPLIDTTKKLVKRAAMLYAWSVILTLIFIVAVWTLHYPSALIPEMPFAQYDWLEAIKQVVLQNYVSGWSYFLKLYWIMLLLAPIAILVLRSKHSWLLIAASVCVWALGLRTGLDWMQWQILFFIPAYAGFYLETIRNFIEQLSPKRQRVLNRYVVTATIATIIFSAFWTQGWPLVDRGVFLTHDQYIAARTWIDPIFSRDPITPGRYLISFLWFTGLLAIMIKLTPFIKRWLEWLLLTFGTRSLTIYTMHALLLLIVQYFVPIYESIIINTLLNIAVIMLAWGLVQLRPIQKVFPR